jgi:hypothetical protein
MPTKHEPLNGKAAEGFRVLLPPDPPPSYWAERGATLQSWGLGRAVPQKQRIRS